MSENGEVLLRGMVTLRHFSHAKPARLWKTCVMCVLFDRWFSCFGHPSQKWFLGAGFLGAPPRSLKMSVIRLSTTHIPTSVFCWSAILWLEHFRYCSGFQRFPEGPRNRFVDGLNSHIQSSSTSTSRSPKGPLAPRETSHGMPVELAHSRARSDG